MPSLHTGQITLMNEFNHFVLSEEFCDKYPHTLVATPGYWIECSRAISDQGSALTIDEGELQEVDEGVSNSPDGSLRDAPSVVSSFADLDHEKDSLLSTPRLNCCLYPNFNKVYFSTKQTYSQPHFRTISGHPQQQQPPPLPSTTSTRKKTPIETQWEKHGQFGLTSVEQETHEKYFYGSEVR